MDERTARATKVQRCIGCGLPLFGFATTPFTDQYGDVYHSYGCFDRCEREMDELAAMDEQR